MVWSPCVDTKVFPVELNRIEMVERAVAGNSTLQARGHARGSDTRARIASAALCIYLRHLNGVSKKARSSVCFHEPKRWRLSILQKTRGSGGVHGSARYTVGSGERFGILSSDSPAGHVGGRLRDTQAAQ